MSWHSGAFTLSGVGGVFAWERGYARSERTGQGLGTMVGSSASRTAAWWTAPTASACPTGGRRAAGRLGPGIELRTTEYDIEATVAHVSRECG